MRNYFMWNFYQGNNEILVNVVVNMVIFWVLGKYSLISHFVLL